MPYDVVPPATQLPAGSYPATTGGCVSVIAIGNTRVSVKFPNGVRGFNIRDTITVTESGDITSSLLGKNGKVEGGIAQM